MTHNDMGREPETIIAAGVKVEGDFISQGDVVIEGIVEGSLKTEKDLRVGERARIDANVGAANAVVAGEVKGNIVIQEKLELQPTARVSGDVQTKILIVADGAHINGRIVMDVDGYVERPTRASKSENERSKKAHVEQEQEKEKEHALSAFFAG